MNIIQVLSGESSGEVTSMCGLRRKLCKQSSGIFLFALGQGAPTGVFRDPNPPRRVPFFPIKGFRYIRQVQPNLVNRDIY